MTVARNSALPWLVLAGLAFAFAAGGPVAVATSRATPPTRAAFCVVAPPWDDAARIIAAAGGRALGPGEPRLGRIARGDHVDFADRLWRAGAWLVLADARLVALCGDAP